MLMFYMLLDASESRDSQRTGWAKVRLKRRESGGGKALSKQGPHEAWAEAVTSRFIP